MNADVLSAIRSGLAGFSKGQKRIAAYILESYDKAAFMTANKLGQTTLVSESTVVRFASELGYKGYPEMQKALQDVVRTRLTSVQRIEVSNSQFSGQDMVSMVLQSDMNTLRLTREALDRKALDAAVDAILNAKNVYLVGVRSSYTLARFLNFYLRIMLNNVHLVDPSATSEIFEQLMHVSKNDTVIGMSLPRYSRRAARAMQFAKNNGATCVAITDNHQAPLAKVSDHVLIAKSDMVSFVDSLVAPLSVVNVLVVAISQKLGKEFSQTMAEMEAIWSEYDIYEHVDI